MPRLPRSCLLVLLLMSALASPARVDAHDIITSRFDYHNDVLPILERHCVSCHQAQGLAPFRLDTYKDARPRAVAIKEQVLSRKMPPWFAEESRLRLQSPERLSAREIDILMEWSSRGGAPVGKPPRTATKSEEAKAPVERRHPDLIVEVSPLSLAAGKEHALTDATVSWKNGASALSRRLVCREHGGQDSSRCRAFPSANVRRKGCSVRDCSPRVRFDIPMEAPPVSQLVTRFSSEPFSVGRGTLRATRSKRRHGYDSGSPKKRRDAKYVRKRSPQAHSSCRRLGESSRCGRQQRSHFTVRSGFDTSSRFSEPTSIGREPTSCAESESRPPQPTVLTNEPSAHIRRLAVYGSWSPLASRLRAADCLAASKKRSAKLPRHEVRSQRSQQGEAPSCATRHPTPSRHASSEGAEAANRSRTAPRGSSRCTARVAPRSLLPLRSTPR